MEGEAASYLDPESPWRDSGLGSRLPQARARVQAGSSQAELQSGAGKSLQDCKLGLVLTPGGEARGREVRCGHCKVGGRQGLKAKKERVCKDNSPAKEKGGGGSLLEPSSDPHRPYGQETAWCPLPFMLQGMIRGE